MPTTAAADLAKLAAQVYQSGTGWHDVVVGIEYAGLFCSVFALLL